MLRKIIFVLIILILWLPLPLSVLKILSEKEVISQFLILKLDKSLDGVSVVPKDPVLSIKNTLNGTFQNNFEKYFSYKMYGRPTMTRIYNQILYSFFNSPNTDFVIIGKDKQLFEPWYPQSYIREIDDDTRELFLENLTMLVSLQKKLEEMGKLLLVLITPSKASIYPEYLPNDFRRYAFMKKAGGYSQNIYEYFLSAAGEKGLKYFDFHDEFLRLKESGMDIYPKGGTHWSGPAVVEYFQELLRVINRTGRNVGTIETIKATPVWGDAFINDDDIELILNLLYKYNNLPKKVQAIFPLYARIFPRMQFYSYHMESLSIPTDYRPSVFVCGESTCWYWLYMLFGVQGWVTRGEAPIFESLEYSWYNTHITKFPENKRIAETTDNFDSIISNEIFIITLNEAQMHPNASHIIFAKNLLDYIMENEKE